jgi:prophage regulatory protein
MQTDTQTNQSRGFYRLPVVLIKIPVSRSAWWQGIKDGRYPAGVKIAPRTTAWRCDDIDRLCSELAKGGR